MTTAIKTTANSLLLFTKIPGLTSVKTRLLRSSNLTVTDVTDLARAFLIDTIQSTVACGCDLFVATEPAISKTDFVHLLKLETDTFPAMHLFPQINASFPERLEAAYTFVYKHNPGAIVIIGSDAPLLSGEQITRALTIANSGTLALGPTNGGGVYCIGIPVTLAKTSFSLSAAFNYSANSDIENLAQLAYSYGVVSQLLEFGLDIDIPEDLVTLAAVLKTQRLMQTAEQAFAKESFNTIERLGICTVIDNLDNRIVSLKR